jgi:hypothetical protein
MIINTSHAVRDRLRCFSWSIFDLPLRLVCDAWQERYIVYTQLSILFGKWETLICRAEEGAEKGRGGQDDQEARG